MRGIRKKIEYILKLRDEVEILEGGSLDYEITIEGSDELASLAGGLDSMRASLLRLMEQETQLVKENQKIITEMSHDLRTPITSIMLYTEILKTGKYQDGAQLTEYLGKIDRKARRMKQLTDRLFAYSLTSGGEEAALEKPETYTVLFYDIFMWKRTMRKGCCWGSTSTWNPGGRARPPEILNLRRFFCGKNGGVSLVRENVSWYHTFKGAEERSKPSAIKGVRGNGNVSEQQRAVFSV